MAVELGLLSLTQLQKLSQSQQIQHPNQLNPTFISSSGGGDVWMWNPKQAQDEDDSWEVRAFAADTGNAMGTTWPPRSYTCSFCRREFRSAQALGGHMNVHRRDRARLHHTQPLQPPPPGSLSSSTSSSALIIPAQEFVANGGLCLLYQLPNPNGVFSTSPTAMNACIDAPSTLLSISPYPAPNTMMNISRPLSVDFPVGTPAVDSTHFYPKSEVPSVSDEMGNSTDDDNKTDNYKESAAIEELDLELRLGQGPTPS